VKRKVGGAIVIAVIAALVMRRSPPGTPAPSPTDAPRGSVPAQPPPAPRVGPPELKLAATAPALAGEVTLTGRVVELGTNQPVAGIRMFAFPGKRLDPSFSISDHDHDGGGNVSDDHGRFEIEHVPRGAVAIVGYPRADHFETFQWVTALRQADGADSIDIGDLAIVRRRAKLSDVYGQLGMSFVPHAPEWTLDEWRLQITTIDPAGPAAHAGLQVGDVITSVDGIDVTGANGSRAGGLLGAPPGTRVTLGLARGAAVSLTLALPPR
jgi:hypothetical protein